MRYVHVAHEVAVERGVCQPHSFQRSESEHIIFTLKLCVIAELSAEGPIIHLAYIHDLDLQSLLT